MKFKIIVTGMLYLWLNPANANECIANVPEVSVLENAEHVSAYEKIEDLEKQIVSEVFHLKDIGDVLVRTESCQHLVWTVIFLTDEQFDSKTTQKERFNKLIAKIFAIPTTPGARFEEFKTRMLDWGNFSQMDEESSDSTYFLWRRNEDTLTDIVFRQKTISSNSLRTRVDYNISL